MLAFPVVFAGCFTGCAKPPLAVEKSVAFSLEFSPKAGVDKKFWCESLDEMEYRIIFDLKFGSGALSWTAETFGRYAGRKRSIIFMWPWFFTVLVMFLFSI
jgi:hypothetical protein